MTPEEVAAATALPIAMLGSKYYFSETTNAALAEAGFSGLSGYVGGRGGVLGDVAVDVVVSAFALFSPSFIEMGWTQTKEQGTPTDAAAAFAEGLGRWSAETFGHLDGLADFAAAARAVFDATNPMSQPLYAGWRAMPVPDDPAAATGLALKILRELRFGFHIHGLSAVGMTPVEAVVAQLGPEQAQMFGWAGPFPDPEPLKPIHQQAEEITTARMNEVYEAIDADQRAHMAATVKAIAAVALG